MAIWSNTVCSLQQCVWCNRSLQAEPANHVMRAPQLARMPCAVACAVFADLRAVCCGLWFGHGPSVFLFNVHGCICTTKQPVRCLCIFWVNGPAHAKGDGAGNIQLWHPTGKVSAHSLKYGLVALGIGSAREQQHEFVASYAPQNMSQWGMRAHYRCEELQYSVTGLMSIGVINWFKSI